MRWCLRGSCTHVDDVELGQQAAVGQCELVPVQETPAGHGEAGVLGELILQGCAQVRVQFPQGLQQATLQG